MRVPEEGNRLLTYREVAPRLADYVAEMGFTHVELMPISEHPTVESWGYQAVSFYAPSGRFGTPQDFMFLVDTLHRKGIGVILDWVPGHFAIDAHGLAEFDGTHLYEPADPRKRKIPDLEHVAFNYESPQVVNFLTANALFWLEKYHIDGLAGGWGRIDDPARLLPRNPEPGRPTSSAATRTSRRSPSSSR